jgi:hypothetical protein
MAGASSFAANPKRPRLSREKGVRPKTSHCPPVLSPLFATHPLKEFGFNVAAIPAAVKAARKYHRVCGASDKEAESKAWEPLFGYLQAAANRK